MQREYKNMSFTHNRACFAPLWLKDVMAYSTTHFVRPFLLYVFDSSLVLASNHNVLPFILSLSFMHTHSLFLYGPGPSQNFHFAFHSGFLYFCMHTMKYIIQRPKRIGSNLRLERIVYLMEIVCIRYLFLMEL